MESTQEIPFGVCCVCGHKLEWHVDEGGHWRCHAVHIDSYQCECILKKDKDFIEGIEYYDLKKRIEENPENLTKVFKCLTKNT